MQVKTITLEYTNDDPIFRVYGVSDLHCGTIHHPAEKVSSFFHTISQEHHARVVDLGDSGEFITPKDPRFEQGSIASYIDPKNIPYSTAKQVASYYGMLPAGSIDGKIEGNHEFEYSKHSDTNVQSIICDLLHVTDLGPSAFIRYIFKRRHSTESHLVTGFFAHGGSSATTKPAKLNMLLKVMDDFEADFYAMGHVHDILTTRNTRLVLDAKGRVRSKSTVGAICGCALRTYTQGDKASYGEKRLYPPTVMGTVCFEIDARTGAVTHKEILY